MSTYKDRYNAADEGLRFQDLVYQGNFKGMPPVPDGILGDRIMRERARSAVLEKVSKEDVLKDQFTLDGMTLAFRRSGGKASGFTLDAGRVRGVAFTRTPG